MATIVVEGKAVDAAVETTVGERDPRGMRRGATRLCARYTGMVYVGTAKRDKYTTGNLLYSSMVKIKSWGD